MMRECLLVPLEAKHDDKLFYPLKFNPRKYVSSACSSMEIYSDSLQGTSHVPLSYMIIHGGCC
jgi:hypothetical protein